MPDIKRKACFLDRDGVIIEEKNYLSDPAGVELLPTVVEALGLLQKSYLLIVLSNQAGVARGYFKESDVIAVNTEISRQLAAKNIHIDAFYYCPHHPDFSGKCGCRKPATGMLAQAVKEHNIDLAGSFMVGDKTSDLEMAKNAGINGIMVLTGHGKNQKVEPGAMVAANLLEAVKRLSDI